MSLRSDILAALKSAGPVGASGEAIARASGVSRVAVAKHISALREMGYTIDAHPGEGYVLTAVPDLVIPAEVAPRLGAPFWVRVEGDATVGSTNDDARALAIAGAAEGTVVVASAQTAGRGRLGRQWESPTGGAYLSAVLRPPVAAIELAPLPLVIALGVARGLESLGCRPRLKWPNDVELASGKVAGILLELSAQADRAEWVVAGIGVNVAADVAQPNAGRIVDEVPDVCASHAAAAVLDGVAAAYLEWLDDGFVALAAEYAARHRLEGEQVTVRDLQGREVAAGAVRGIDSFGRLLVESDGRVVAVPSGDVTLRA